MYCEFTPDQANKQIESTDKPAADWVGQDWTCPNQSSSCNQQLQLLQLDWLG